MLGEQMRTGSRQLQRNVRWVLGLESGHWALKLIATIVLAAVLSLGGATAGAQVNTAIRVNAGGPAYTDSAGNVWSADTGYNSGCVFSFPQVVSGTSDPTLYSDARCDASPAAPTLQYSFTVPNGTYEVRLHFAEPLLGPGGRRFDFRVEGALYSNFDIAAEVGLRVALVKSHIAQVSDGEIHLEFLHGPIENPFISAIEILSTFAPTNLSAATKSGTQLNLNWTASTGNPAVIGYRVERCSGANCTNFAEIATAPTTSYADSGLAGMTHYRYRLRAVDSAGNVSAYSLIAEGKTSTAGPYSAIRVNAGGGAYTDTAGRIWAADSNYNSGTTYSTNPFIAGTNDDALYSVGRYDAAPAPPILQYSFAMPNGTYDVHLLFAEPGVPPGGRLFDVRIENTTVFTNLDIASEVGIQAAVTKAASVQVMDGYLDIQLLHGPAENPFVSAIEIIQTAAADSRAPSTPLLGVSPYSGSRLDVSWTLATDAVGVTRYRLERCQGTSCSSFVEIATPTGTTFSDTGLASGVVYRYRIRAEDAAGNVSPYSPIGAAMTFAGGGGTQPPTAPSLSATSEFANRVDLSWTASTDDVGVINYFVERCIGVACTSFSRLAMLPTITAFRDTTVVGGATYRYRVRARDADDMYSPYSSIESVTTSLDAGTAGSTTYQHDSFGRLKQVTVVPH